MQHGDSPVTFMVDRRCFFFFLSLFFLFPFLSCDFLGPSRGSATRDVQVFRVHAAPEKSCDISGGRRLPRRDAGQR